MNLWIAENGLWTMHKAWETVDLRTAHLNSPRNRDSTLRNQHDDHIHVALEPLLRPA